HIGRVEEHERIEAKTDLKRVLHGGSARHGVKDSGRPALSEFRRYILVHPLEITAELCVGVVGGRRRFILAMIAKIENDEIEAIEKMLPVRQVAVDGVTVAMAEEKPHTLWIAVSAHANPGAVIE